MYLKLLKNDIKYNPPQTFNIMLFVSLAVAFLAAAGQMTVLLISSVNSLFLKAKTPHILQMHTGDLDEARMEEFVRNHQEIKEYQILHFLNIDNSLLYFNTSSLSDSVYDNGFSVQSESFDYLLNMDGDIIEAGKGEVYVPVAYLTSGLAKEGDILRIGEHELTVAGFVRDSQMNSSISVSKRFIVSREDYEHIKDLGSIEYLIEFRLHDTADIAAIESAYSEAKLEADGPPFMSYSLFMLVNAFSDGISIASLLIISVLIIVISMLCIRLTLLARLEEDYKELAVLKAIGIPHKDIRKVFLYKYLMATGAAVILGFIASFFVKIPLLSNMRMFFGNTRDDIWVYLIAAVLSICIFLVVAMSMNKTAKKLKKLKISNAFEAEEGRSYRVLSKLPATLKLALGDIFGRKKIYLTMTAVFILSIFVLTIPMSMYSTVSDENFMNYLGAGGYDVRFDIAKSGSNDAAIKNLIQEIEAEENVENHAILRGKLINYKTDTGIVQSMWVDFGDHEAFPAKYISGENPAGDGEIALSKLRADEMEKKTGDELVLMIDGKEKNFKISGIFSDLTNGGKTAKANFDTGENGTIKLIIPVRLKENSDIKSFISRYQEMYVFAKIADAKTYLHQIMGNTIKVISGITRISFAACVFLVFLITLLFIRMLYLKDRGENALLKAIGFQDFYIYRQYFIKTVIILAAGIVFGYLLTISLGDALGSGLLAAIGVAGVRFIRNPIFMYLLVPLAMLLSTLCAVYFGISGIRGMNISILLKEDA